MGMTDPTVPKELFVLLIRAIQVLGASAGRQNVTSMSQGTNPKLMQCRQCYVISAGWHPHIGTKDPRLLLAVAVVKLPPLKKRMLGEERTSLSICLEELTTASVWFQCFFSHPLPNIGTFPI